ncbi:hypothetical protein DBV05_g859 [Lasiodiplodia theobromae]|uniref:Uncharacterized protein n=1 Tax=Lasiodiplodia theobromae TaxID=45133 RepID=A0A5N5DRN1_9PEZI|nr:hypothetical protein DBV05_g859 [Lasiodiplodia theobromae]
MPLNLVIDFPEDEDEPWVIEHRIFDVLSEYLQPTSQASPAEVALKFNELFQLNQRENEKANPEGFLWQLWDIVFNVAEQVPYSHTSQDRLVELIAALRDAHFQPNPFAELKCMGPALTERFNQISTEPPTSDDGEGSNPWKNLNALAARLTRAGFGVRSRDAVIAFSLALENRPHPRSRAYQERGRALNFHVPIAADWMQKCARELYLQMKSGESVEGPPWKGKRGIFDERWNFWKEQFGDIAEREDACEDAVREGARLAAQKMIEAESSDDV